MRICAVKARPFWRDLPLPEQHVYIMQEDLSLVTHHWSLAAALFMPQGHHGVNFRRAPGWNVAGEKRHAEEDQRYGSER